MAPDTTPPQLASKTAQSAYGCVMAGALMGGFLFAGLLAMLAPLPRHLEGLRDPLSVGLGLGSILAVVVLGFAPLVMFRPGERRRMDRLFGHLGLTGRADVGHGMEYRGTRQGREVRAAVTLDGASPVTRLGRAELSLDAQVGCRFLVAPRGSPHLHAYENNGTKHILLVDRPEVDVRASHPEHFRRLAADPELWTLIEDLMRGLHDAHGLVQAGPRHLMVGIAGEGATLFDHTVADDIFERLTRLALAIEAAGLPDNPATDSVWHEQAHTNRRALRIQQWAMSAGCLTLVLAGWAAWVLAVLSQVEWP